MRNKKRHNTGYTTQIGAISYYGIHEIQHTVQCEDRHNFKCNKTGLRTERLKVDIRR